jgi:hypothetical protein
MMNRNAYDDYVTNYADAPHDARVTSLDLDWQVDELDRFEEEYNTESESEDN